MFWPWLWQYNLRPRNVGVTNQDHWIIMITMIFCCSCDNYFIWILWVTWIIEKSHIAAILLSTGCLYNLYTTFQTSSEELVFWGSDGNLSYLWCQKLQHHLTTTGNEKREQHNHVCANIFFEHCISSRMMNQTYYSNGD